jgi:D-sedoheptulose 7-phosphate isomerase
MPDIKGHIAEIFSEHRQYLDKTLPAVLAQLISWIEQAKETFSRGGKLLVFGNGGSAADACHLVSELVGRLSGESPALPAIALNTDPAVITSLSNDFGYDFLFHRQLEALTKKGDMVLAISTSGRSVNCIRGLELANSLGAVTVALSGQDGGELAKISSLSIIVPGENTQRLQEMHELVIHAFCDVIKEWGKSSFSKG